MADVSESPVELVVGAFRQFGVQQPDGVGAAVLTTRMGQALFMPPNVKGWPGIDSPAVKDFIAEMQIDAAGWFVANPQVTVVDVRRYQRMEQALDTFFDAMAANTAMDATTREALSALSDAVATPQGVDY